MKKIPIYILLLSLFFLFIFIPCSQTIKTKASLPKVATVTMQKKLEPVVNKPDKEKTDSPMKGINDGIQSVHAKANPNQNRNIPVLMYHSISNVPGNYLCVPPEIFEEQIKTILDYGFKPITATTYLSAMEKGTPLPKNPILITFDDGYLDNYDAAFPILKKYNVKVTIFMISGLIDKDKRMLSSNQILEMDHSGLVDFQSHTVHHRYLSKIPPEEANQELKESKKALELLLNKKIRILGIPYGDYSPTVLKLIQQNGYGISFCSNQGVANYNQQQAYYLNRFTVYPDRPLIYLLKYKKGKN